MYTGYFGGQVDVYCLGVGPKGSGGERIVCVVGVVIGVVHFIPGLDNACMCKVTCLVSGACIHDCLKLTGGILSLTSLL